jgi:hypothetical protein
MFRHKVHGHPHPSSIADEQAEGGQEAEEHVERREGEQGGEAEKSNAAGTVQCWWRGVSRSSKAAQIQENTTEQAVLDLIHAPSPPSSPPPSSQCSNSYTASTCSGQDISPTNSSTYSSTNSSTNSSCKRHTSPEQIRAATESAMYPGVYRPSGFVGSKPMFAADVEKPPSLLQSGWFVQEADAHIRRSDEAAAALQTQAEEQAEARAELRPAALGQAPARAQAPVHVLSSTPVISTERILARLNAPVGEDTPRVGEDTPRVRLVGVWLAASVVTAIVALRAAAGAEFAVHVRGNCEQHRC